MKDWVEIFFDIYKVLKLTVDTIKGMDKIRKIMAKEYLVNEIKEELQTGELHFGDKISVLGTFSEYVPFIDPKFIFKDAHEISLFPKTLPRTARLESINDIYCGALFQPDQGDAFSEEVIPIFYRNDSPMIQRSTGEMLKIDAKITKVPMDYMNIINKTEYFAFEKEEGVTIPFGLDVKDVELYGLIDTFKVNSWLVGNLEPFPRLITQEKMCLTCKNVFAYMAVDPFDWPIKYGCYRYKAADTDTTDEMKKSTEEFVELEKKASAFINFPKLFGLFEVFCPNIDILNDEQRKYSTNILLSAINENIEQLLRTIPVWEGAKVEFPKKIKINTDFQYDQVNKITQQQFDPNAVSQWICPYYKPRTRKKDKTKK